MKQSKNSPLWKAAHKAVEEFGSQPTISGETVVMTHVLDHTIKTSSGNSGTIHEKYEVRITRLDSNIDAQIESINEPHR